MSSFFIQFLNGITFAGLLFMMASGFTLIFGVMRVVNMSHGMFYILGGYIGYAVQVKTGNWFLAIIAGSLAVGLLAFAVEKIVFLMKTDFSQTVLTIGISFMLRDLCLIIWGGIPRTIGEPMFTQNPINVFGLKYPGFRLFVLLLAIVVGILLWFMLKRTQFGRILRAGTDNRAMVSALGVNIDRNFTLIFIVTGLLTGLSGAVGGTYIAFGPGTDFTILTYALVVVIMGGLGSIAGSAIGAIIVGLVDSFGRTNIPELTNFLLMGSLVIVLIFKPHGLLGRKE